MTQFDLVAMGGTFDIIHKGHLTLLSGAFSISSKVIIGLTSDEMATKKGKKLQNNYQKRLETLEKTIEKNFPHSLFEISKLDNDFGPAVLEKNVQALVVSGETSNQGKVLNDLRDQKKLPPVEVVVIPMVLAKDGQRISTTRIKNHEIDLEGNLSSFD
ncbi:MAG: phosphopantetheine adenylyltransferase [Nitrosopumilaceae archaeon]|uniref:Pantetheine-phosphate adenylyltransferase n=1 Tax=Candidatus Nitrosomaritimum aestuariumsis TaxID=3342354 RepID=A0AC60W5Q2_9ARCH|nr:pantetheine-phosphate adenylyltransferase [Nitrosopumilaceae archaeon]